MTSPTHPLLELITAAVADTIADSDEPVGAVLSGGIDSSTVVCCARLAGHDLPTFTGYYDEGDRFDERRYAQLVCGDDWHRVKITPQHIEENFDAMLQAFEPPFQGPGAMGQFIVAKYVAEEGLNTVLSGEGGDELFGGYARLMAVAGHPLPDGYENYEPPFDYPTSIEAALAYDWERLPDLLAVDDQACGAWGITARAPMTDPGVVDYVLAQPAELRVGKALLREAAQGVVPDEILARTDKMGMPGPFVQWGQGPLRAFFLDRIGYAPDPAQPWDRRWWYDLVGWHPAPVRAAA